MCLMGRGQLWRWHWAMAWERIGNHVACFGGDGALAVWRLEWAALWRAIGDLVEGKAHGFEPPVEWAFDYQLPWVSAVLRVSVEFV